MHHRTVIGSAIVCLAALLSACGVMLSAVVVPKVERDMTGTPGVFYKLHDTGIRTRC